MDKYIIYYWIGTFPLSWVVISAIWIRDRNDFIKLENGHLQSVNRGFFRKEVRLEFPLIFLRDAHVIKSETILFRHYRPEQDILLNTRVPGSPESILETSEMNFSSRDIKEACTEIKRKIESVEDYFVNAKDFCNLYVSDGNEIRGPYNQKEVFDYYCSGEIGFTTLMTARGDNQWQTVESFLHKINDRIFAVVK